MIARAKRALTVITGLEHDDMTASRLAAGVR
jgi:hypothetical protein